MTIPLRTMIVDHRSRMSARDFTAVAPFPFKNIANNPNFVETRYFGLRKLYCFFHERRISDVNEAKDLSAFYNDVVCFICSSVPQYSAYHVNKHSFNTQNKRHAFVNYYCPSNSVFAWFCFDIIFGAECVAHCS